jgi:hypothetical protein
VNFDHLPAGHVAVAHALLRGMVVRQANNGRVRITILTRP